MAANVPPSTDSQASIEVYLRQNVNHLSATHYQIAKSLELCYLRGFNYPEFSKEVCGYAATARGLQESCSGLMQTFGTNAHQMANEGIPNIIELLEIGEKELVIGFFNEVIGQAREMSQQADETTQRCVTFSMEVCKSHGKVKREQASRQKELEDVEEKKVNEEMCRKTTEREIDELDVLVKEILSKIDSLENDKKHIKEEMDEIIRDIWDRRFNPFGFLTLGMYFLVDIMRYSGKAVSMGFKSRAVSKFESNLLEQEKKKYRVENTLSEQKEMIDVLSCESEKLTEECDDLVDIFPLLTKLQDNLTQLRSFWDATAALLIGFKQRVETNRFFYEKAKQPKNAKIIKRNLEKLEKSFSDFGMICDTYVHGCTHDPKLAVQDLFSFMDGRVEVMDKSKLKAQIVSVENELE